MPKRDSKGKFTAGPGSKRKGGIFTFDSLTPALQQLLPRVDAAVDIVFDRYEAIAETYARTNAPWSDQTGNARAGLFAEHESEPMVVHRLVVYGTMDYTYWLEVRWSGRYAIIGPTLVHIAPQMAADIAAAVSRAVRS
jgi:hypothetical protein